MPQAFSTTEFGIVSGDLWFADTDGFKGKGVVSEIFRDGRPGRKLKVLVQPPDKPIDEAEARKCDLILSSNPANLPDWAKAKHPLGDHEGAVRICVGMIADVPDGTAVSDVQGIWLEPL